MKDNFDDLLKIIKFALLCVLFALLVLLID